MLKESQIVEFKQIWRDEYLKTICTFSNSEGGTLYIGLDDSGNVVGVENIKSLIEILPNKFNNRLGLLVEIKPHFKNVLDYLEIKVNKTYAPVSYNGKFYKRSGSNTVELNGNNLSNFLLKKYGNEGISGEIKLLYEYIEKNPNKGVSQIFKNLQVPEKTLARWIKRLREEGKIEHIGSKKTGGYYVKKSD